MIERTETTAESALDEAWKSEDRRYHEQHEVAATYDRRVARYYRLDHRRYTLDPWARAIEAAGARSVLDFGCGTGNATIRYRNLDAKVISLDASIAMVAALRAKARRAGIPAYGLVADGERLPFADGSLDAIVCTGVLHHMPQIGSAVRGQIRALGDEGLLFISEPYGERPWFSQPGHLLFSLAKRIRDRLKNAVEGARERPLNRGDVAEIRATLDAAGLRHRITCFAYWPYVCGYLPEGIAWPLMRLLDRLKPNDRGDAVRFEARGAIR